MPHPRPWLLLLLLLLVLLGLLAPASGQSAGEQNALAQFYKSVTPKGTFSWDTNSPLCLQEGVTCIDGAVTKLALQTKLSGGSISSYIAQLPNLQEVNLYGNSLSGAIPTEIGNMKNLQNLYLYINSLSGTIPTEIGNMENLLNLQINTNSLSGAIPTEIGSLKNLQTVWMYSNSLSGAIPTELGNLKNLQTFQLYSNSLSGTIPTEIGNMENLRTLPLYANSLTGTIPTQLGQLTKLTQLQLQDNRLSGTIPSELDNIPLIRLLLGGTNYFCPLTDYSAWASIDDSPTNLTCTACGASFPLCQSGEVCLGGVNEPFTCAEPICPIVFGTGSLQLAPGQAAEVQVSLGGDPFGTTTVNLESNCALLSTCSLSFDSSNFGTPQTITVTGGTSNPATVCYVRASTDGDACAGSQVEIIQPGTPFSSHGIIYGDPSVATFSNTRFQLPRIGNFTLLQAADGEFAAQVRTGSCENKGICVFELAIQKGTFMATLAMGMDGTLAQLTTGNEAENGVTLLTQGGRHWFRLTTGLHIAARAGFTPSSQQYALMVVVSASSSYRNRLAGLLGSFSGVKNEDLLLPDGTFTTDASAFLDAWEVAGDSENLLLSYPIPVALSPVSGVTPFDPSTVEFNCQA